MSPSTHPYGDHPHQFGELSLPVDAVAGRPVPVAVLLHGGFWLAEHGLARMRPLAGDLAARGWAAWNVEYRRIGGDSGGGWPRTPDDVAASIDHLAELVADGAPLDLGCVVVVGHSAGGHLALVDAARAPGTRVVGVRAVAALAPLTDVLQAHGFGGATAETVEAFLGGAPQDRAAEYAAASPVTHVPVGVPQLVVRGDRDEMVPPAMVDAYVSAAREAGDEVTLHRRPGDGHFDIVEPDSGAWAEVMAYLDAVPSGPA